MILYYLPEYRYQINNLLYEKFEGNGGTTVAFVMMYKGAAYWVSVGDSTIYLKRNNGLYKLNKEHTYLNELYLNEIYQEVIDKREIDSNKDGVRLSEFMGNRKINEIDYNKKPLYLLKNDVILLCSDGISSFLSEEVITEALSYSPDIACKQLSKLINDKYDKRQDNFTAIVIACM